MLVRASCRLSAQPLLAFVRVCVAVGFNVRDDTVISSNGMNEVLCNTPSVLL